MASQWRAWSLRPVTQQDFEWLFALHKEALGEYVAQTWGWEEEFQRQLFKHGLERPGRQIIQIAAQRRWRP